ncbi:MAG: hypothetical protein IPJ77_14080 [Planctomycetes bacterium]|nr:hypothetical protein [Planctomycetota bacterium]
MNPTLRLASSSLVLLAMLAPLRAQNATVSWSAAWDGPASQDDYVTKLVVDATGGVVVVGRSYNASVGFPPAPPTQDALVARYDASGTLLWSQRPDWMGGDDLAQDVAIDPATGDVLVAGYANGYVASTFVTDLWLARYDANGTELWSVHEDGTGASADFGRTILIDGTGRIFVGGSSYGPTTSADLAVFAFDPSGAFLWETHVDGLASSTDSGGFLAWHPSGDLVLSGMLASLGGAGDMGVARITTSGAIVWQAQLDGPAHGADFGLGAACDAAGNVYVAGWATIGADSAPRLAKWSASGAFQWAADFPEAAAGAGQFRDLVVDAAGRIAVVGHAATGATGLDLVVAQYDANGTLLWSGARDGAAHGDESARAIVVDGAGNVTACGWANGPTGTTDADSLVVQYGPNGAARWTHGGVDAAVEDRAQDLALGPAGRVVYGAYLKPGTRYDVRLVALDEQAVAYCFGDGSFGACPCANESGAGLGEGCKSSLGRGATLVDTGIASLASDTLVLNGAGMTNANALYLQGALAATNPAAQLGDGLLCMGGTIIRLGSKANAGGASRYPEVGNASVSVRGAVTAPGTRAYQVWYRNAASFCTSATYNLSNGLIVTWAP